MKFKSYLLLIGMTVVLGIGSNAVYASIETTKTKYLDADSEIKRVVNNRSFKSLGSETKSSEYYSSDKVNVESAYVAALQIKEQQEEQEAMHEEWVAMNGDGLLAIENPDPNYNGQVVVLDEQNRDLLERLVMGEAGGEGVEGAALVAQCLHDTMIKDNNYDVASIITGYKYTGKTDREPNENVKEAVSIVFDQGGYAVKHRIIYFYAPALCVSNWHETQDFIIEYGGHRVFDRR